MRILIHSLQNPEQTYELNCLLRHEDQLAQFSDIFLQRTIAGRFQQSQSFYLFLGAKTTTGLDGMPYNVMQFFIHPLYNPFVFPGPYDIALIRLSRRLQIPPVRLPVSGAPITDAECWVAGQLCQYPLSHYYQFVFQLTSG